MVRQEVRAIPYHKLAHDVITRWHDIGVVHMDACKLYDLWHYSTAEP